MLIRKPISENKNTKLLLAAMTENKHPLHRVRQLQALLYLSLVLNLIMLFVVWAIL